MYHNHRREHQLSTGPVIEGSSYASHLPTMTNVQSTIAKMVNFPFVLYQTLVLGFLWLQNDCIKKVPSLKDFFSFSSFNRSNMEATVTNVKNTITKMVKFPSVLYQNLMICLLWLQNDCIEEVRPWKDFFSFSSFNRSNLKDKLQLNLKTYRSNYVVIGCIVLFCCLNISLHSTLINLAVFTAVLKLVNFEYGDSIVIDGRRFAFPLEYQLGVVWFLLVPHRAYVLLLQSTGIALIISTILNGIHAAFHDVNTKKE